MADSTAVPAWPPEANCGTVANSASGDSPLRIGGGNDPGWGYVYRDASKKGGRDALGWGPQPTEGEFSLSYDLFAISASAEGYVENSYEVTHHGKDGTQIRLVRDKGDKVVMMQTQTGSPNSSMKMIMTFDYPGARVRCGARTYELQADGWHLDGKAIHAFQKSVPGAIERH